VTLPPLETQHIDLRALMDAPVAGRRS